MHLTPSADILEPDSVNSCENKPPKNFKPTFKLRAKMQYSGQILDGQMHGKGRLVYDNGEVYSGDWVRGKRHGRGEYVYNDGTKFEGHWDNDRINGL